MKLAFKCRAVTHTSGRVTLTPLELPELAVHARTLEEARFELTLALDDRIGRAHPRHLWRYCNPGAGALVTLEVPALSVPLGEAVETLPLVLDALECPAHAGHTEARVFSADVRFWFKAKGLELRASAVALLVEHVKDLSPASRLWLRREGRSELVDLEVEVTPLSLSVLKRSELRLDERPAPRPPEEEPSGSSSAEAADGEADAVWDDDGWDDDRPKRERARGGAKRRPAMPTLSRLGLKWHQLAKDGAFPLTFGRDAVVEQVLAHLSSRDPEPLVLLGPSGVGKTAVLQEVARRLAALATEANPARPFFLLDGSRLVAGQGFFGDWQRQTLDAFAEAREAAAVLHLGRLVDLLDAGRSAQSDDNVAQLLTPTLAGREVAVVAEATSEEWARVRDRNQGFARLFAPLTIAEPSPADAASMVARIAAHEGAQRGVEVEAGAVDEVRTLVRRFRPYGSALGNAVAFLRRLLDQCAHARQRRLTRGEVVRRFSGESGVPEELLRDELPLDPLEVRAFLGARVMGQSAAVARVAQVVSVIKANLADPRRPVATLLFAGPTGVGKTELCKALAERVYGSKDRLVRLDMGEYAGPDAIARLIGDETAEGFLPVAVRRQPFSVVLLDELEKAHPAVFDALLSVLGEGRLTGGRGRLTDFRSTVLVMTSNLGAQGFKARVGFDGGDPAEEEAALRAHTLGEVRRFFRPELFNRLDEVVVFGALARPHLTSIVERELAKVAARPGFGRLEVQLATPPSVVEALTQWGFEPRYGARPLKRAIERLLVAPAAAHLAAHRPSGASRLEISREGEQLTFSLHPVGRAAEGGARAAVLEQCEDAATLRGEVRAWMRSPLMARLREQLRLFERLSRSPSFWLDRSLAETEARRAATVKDLWEAFARVRGQAEAAEELAFDAYVSRTPGAAHELSLAIASAREAFTPLTERLFAGLSPPGHGATLTLVPGKGAAKWARWLLDVYTSWLNRRGLKFELHALVAVGPQARRGAAAPTLQISADPIVRVFQQQGAMAAIKAHRDAHGSSPREAQQAVARVRASLESPAKRTHEWRRGLPADDGRWEALALQVQGDVIPMLLSAEHGAHRVYVGSESFTVKVRFQAGIVRLGELGFPQALEAAMPGLEIRRAWPLHPRREQARVRDLRTQTDHLATEAGFELGEALAAYVRLRVFGAEELEWI